ncbi:unnamed protein product [Peronospora farinosa]|uniref:Uncharacterized protein n=1 Tax=Peronospora farinosa TaxID=134698 RepID=A0AAV0SW64_9STRA|nr:unnamed protein product [Peronospora farinosa]CAI5709450.1 unnamed protein product [Peronospora farinosa]
MNATGNGHVGLLGCYLAALWRKGCSGCAIGGPTSFGDVQSPIFLLSNGIRASASISIDAVFAVMKERHTSDNEANSAVCHVIQDGQIVDRKWADITQEPASEPSSGICYVETTSMDGETNVKLRQAVAATMNALSNPAELAVLRGVVKC